MIFEILLKLMLHLKSMLKPVLCSRNMLLPVNHAARVFAENLSLDRGSRLGPCFLSPITVCVKENALRTSSNTVF